MRLLPDQTEPATVALTIAVPRSALTVAAAPPELVSQKTSEAVLGIPRRAFLDSLPAFRAQGGEVATLGKLRLVDRVAFVAWLRSRGAQRVVDPVRASNDDLVAAELGLRAVGGGVRR